jgi:hypothetical protein
VGGAEFWVRPDDDGPRSGSQFLRRDKVAQGLSVGRVTAMVAIFSRAQGAQSRITNQSIAADEKKALPSNHFEDSA